MAAFQARPRTLPQPTSLLLSPTSEDPLERPQSPSSSLHFGDEELEAYHRDGRKGEENEVPESEREWIVFKPRSPSPVETEDATPKGGDGGESMLASGWTAYHSTHADEMASPSRVYLPMPRHDGSGRFSVPSPSLSSTSRLSGAQQGAALDTSLYASAPSQLLAPPSTTHSDTRRQSRTLSEGSYSSYDGATLDDDDDVLSLPSSLSLSQTWSENASPNLRPAATSLEASARTNRTRGASGTPSSVSVLSIPGSPSFHPHDNQEGTQLTASALSTVPLAKASSSARLVWTSDSDNGADSEDDAVEVNSQDARDEDELSRTPHAQSAGLSGFTIRRVRRPPPPTRSRASERSALTDRTNTTSASERVKRRHRRAAKGRVSEDGSTKRSATGREKERVAQPHPVSQPPTVVEEKEEAEKAARKGKVDWVTRVARKMMDVDEETVRLLAEARPAPVVSVSTTPRPSTKSRSTRVTLRRSAPTRPITGRHARFSLGDSPMDLSGAYRARYDDSDCYDSDEDVTMSDAETEVDYHQHRSSYLAHSGSYGTPAVSMVSSSAVRTRPLGGSPTHRSLSLSSIPAYLLTTLLGTQPSAPGSPDLSGGEVRRTASVLFKPGTSRAETASPERENAVDEEVLSSREQAVGYWRRVLRAWAGW